MYRFFGFAGSRRGKTLRVVWLVDILPVTVVESAIYCPLKAVAVELSPLLVCLLGGFSSVARSPATHTLS